MRKMVYITLLLPLFLLSSCALAGGRDDSESLEEVLEVRPLKPTAKQANKKTNKTAKAKAKRISEKKAASKGDKALDPVKAAVSRYGEFALVSMKIKKKFIPMVGKPKNSKGKLYYSKGKLRLEISKPKSLMVFDGKQIWLVDDGSEFGSGDLISRVQLNGDRRKGNAFLAFLFEDVNGWDQFKVLKNKKGKSTVSLELEPKKGAKLPDIAKLYVKVNNKTKKIVKIAYWDQFDSEVSYEFSKIKLHKKAHPDKFKYTPPKGADITEY